MSKTITAWTLAEDCLDGRDRAAVRSAALDTLTPADRAAVERTAKRLARDVRKLGEESALRLLAVIGGLLAENPEWMEVPE